MSTMSNHSTSANHFRFYANHLDQELLSDMTRAADSSFLACILVWLADNCLAFALSILYPSVHR